MVERKAYFSIVTIGIITLISLSVLILLSPTRPVYDEIQFIANNTLFDELGLSKRFLVEMEGQSPGPLYQIIHYIFKPLTRYAFPQTDCVALDPDWV